MPQKIRQYFIGGAWLHTVRKKTARLTTRINATLGLISLTRDEEFERHYENFKHLEKTIRVFIKNLTAFVQHFERFLLALQNTSEHLADFYHDKSHQRELDELRKKNKALACEHFHAFKRTVDRQVISVAGQLLQKFAGPHQLVSKRSAKLLDYDTKAKEMESCRESAKKEALRDQYVIAKEIYDRINGQLIEELPMFTQFAMDIFRDCILVLLESRRNLILSYTKQTASLLELPLMATYTASDVASQIMMMGEMENSKMLPPGPGANDMRRMLEQAGGSKTTSRQTSEHGTQPSSSSSGTANQDLPRLHSAASQLSSEFDQMTLANRDICSTPLSQVSGSVNQSTIDGVVHAAADVRFYDEPDGDKASCNGQTDNQLNENIETRALSELGSRPPSARDGPPLEVGSSASSNDREAVENDNKPDNGRKRSRKKFEIVIAEWPFMSTGPNQLTISSDQPLKLIKSCDECGNSDWSLVKDKKGQMGYVPSSYIKRRD